MEKMEYRNRIEEMQDLISQNKFADAMSVAETVNWRKVHNINDLIAGSECYEAAGKTEDARELLFLAHERSPIGRMIIYKLCMISIKLKDIEMAQEYYNEFVQIAPHDSLKYILKYNINMAKGADTATLIKILEQLKESDFIEEWAYELAYLYHKTNQADKCISLCDEIILWFGDGPVVERALELKMLYQPLDKAQEDKYRSFQQKKDGIAEIYPQPIGIDSSAVLPDMPVIELPKGPERFDTINLQAEIKKNIDEIMKATDTGEVSENIGAIKNLVEEIPYLKVKDEPVPQEEEFSVNETFNQYLREGMDGQISLLLPDDADKSEEQIEGQLTIEDVLAEWEKTKRAAEAAMEEAKSKELETARAKALREANSVLNRLEGVMSKLDAGMTSAELLKEEYLSDADIPAQEPVQQVHEIPEPEVLAEPEVQEPEVMEEPARSFSIPKLNSDGLLSGSVDIPIVQSAAATGAAVGAMDAVMHAAGELKEENWQPPTLEGQSEETEEVDFKEASQMIADVNDFLQQEIDRLTSGATATVNQEPQKYFEVAPKDIVLPESINSDYEETAQEPVLDDIQIDEVPLEDINISDITIEEPVFDEPVNTVEEEPIVEEPQYEEPLQQEVYEPEINIADIELPKIELPQDILEDIAPKMPEVEQVSLEEEPVRVAPVPVQQPVSATPVAGGIDIDDEDLEIFSYFLPINGMKKSIVSALAGAASHLNTPNDKGGSIIIVGEPGSGKTQMATSLIKVLEKKTGYPKGGIGKISGEKLNEKDIQKLYSKIQGGCLIIETAGGISKETAVTLSLLMEQDDTGTILIIEDNKKGIDKALSKDSSFAKRFTEKVVIPVFSIDELVSFAKTYALEAECSIDDMGILALYNRINLIGRYDHATTIKEVAEIMDEAIEKSTRGGFFNKPKYDKNGYVILKEKDFDR